MLFAKVGTERRQPERKGERATCPQCESEVIAVVPIQNVRHWRHRTKDCDSWSEPEGQWHLSWKERFKADCREVTLVDALTKEIHRADICCDYDGRRTIVELQHSSIGEHERIARESFYGKIGRMFWLLHLHDEGSFRGTYFRLSLDFKSPIEYAGKTFYIMRWVGNTQFIERWKRSKVHVFFDCKGDLYYLATDYRKMKFFVPWAKGTFLVCPLTTSKFIAAVAGSDPHPEEPTSGKRP